MNITTLTANELRRAANIKERMDALEDELNEILGSTVQADGEAPKKYKFSAAARAKMRRAQKARWARIKGTAPEAGPAKKGKRKMSAQGLANIRAGVAKRMAAQGRVVAKPRKKRKMTPAWRAALARAWAARRAQAR